MAAAAYFDVDGTLARSNIVRYYVHFRTRGMPAARRWLWIAGYLPQVARWIWLDRRDRARMNREFYRGYAGLSLADLRRAMDADYPRLLGRRVFPAARERIAWHRRRGDRVVLVTGSLDFVIEPLARDVGADDLIAVRLQEDAGVLTGELVGAPLAGAEKLARVREHAGSHDVELARSWAYGDALSDAAVLERTGHPVAVNPDPALARLARERGWELVRWRPERGSRSRP